MLKKKVSLLSHLLDNKSPIAPFSGFSFLIGKMSVDALLPVFLSLSLSLSLCLYLSLFLSLFLLSYLSHLLSFSSPIFLISYLSHLLSFSSPIFLISYLSHLLSFSSPIFLFLSFFLSMKNTCCLFQIKFITEYTNVQHIIITQI